MSSIRLARLVFRIAGIYGIFVLAPQYFLESRMGRDFPPAITHPENYYGFIGVALAWQILYLVISTDPVRYRTVMLVGAFGKMTFVVACVVLYIQGRLSPVILGFAGTDLLLAILFVICYRMISIRKETA